VHQKSPPD